MFTSACGGLRPLGGTPVVSGAHVVSGALGVASVYMASADTTSRRIASTLMVGV